MSGSGRKRSSKWDLRDEPPFEDVNVASDSWPGKGSRSFLHIESRHGWQSPDLVGDNGSRWCALETNDIRSKHDSGFPSRENIPGSRGSHKSENIDKDNSGYAADSSWDRDGSYDSRMSPGLDKWRQRSHSQSPRVGWSRSLRGRTRSRSCSRSRSPVRGYRRDSGYVDRNRSRSGVSSKLCRDFAAGRCRRGDQCHFLHEGRQTYEDNWDGRHRKGGSSNYSTLHDTRDNPSRNERPATNCNDFVKGKCRRGASCRFDHHGAADGLGKGFGNDVSLEEENDRRKRETSIEQGLNREPRRNSDIPCRFFAAGNCRNGRYCRFSHNSRASASPDRKYQDERRGPGQKLNYGDQMLRDSKWSNSVPLTTSAKLDENKNGNIGISERRSAWSANDTGFGSTVDSQNKIYSDPAVGHEAAKCNDEETVGWKAENIGASMAPSESRHTEDMSPDWNYSIKSSNCVLKEENSPSTLASEFVSLNDSSLTTLERSITQDAVALSLDTDTAEKTALHADLNISANNILSSQSFDQTGHHSGVFPPSVNTIGQNQVVIPTELQGGFLKIPEHKTRPSGGKCVSGRDFGDFKTPVVDAGIKMVTSEQLSELTNLSSSLAQLLGNGQLYAALNPSDSMGTSSFAKSEVSVQPIPVIESQKHYDPICDSEESKKPENSYNPPAILPNATIQTCFTVGKSEKEQNNLIESSFLGGPCSDDHHRSEISTKLNGESQLELKALSEVGMVNNGQRAKENIKSQEDSRKTQDNDPLEDKDGKDDGKKGKDVKVIRAFKFALAEFVKELLKPTWKEGQINKDAYKTIVKKVVDKVTGTVQGANIPQTQEKIDHYLSSSKPKLMKLVQAYVGKAQKG